MDALLLALLLGLALDQGDRSQRLVGIFAPGVLVPVCLIIIVGAGACALFGRAVAPYLAGPAGLLFFAIALILGAVGLLVPNREGVTPGGVRSGGLPLYGKLLLHRLADRSSFLFVGISAMTGNAWGTALGGAIGGLGALLPPLLAGAAYERALPLGIIRPVLGVLLLVAGFGCALNALGLL